MDPHWFVVMTVALSLAALIGFRAMARNLDQSRFENARETVQDSIRARLDAYESILRATRSHLISQDGQLDLRGFRSFVSDLHIAQRYPGIQGIGFSQRVDEADIDALTAQMRRQGQEGFHVWPQHPRAEYHAVVFLEPLDRRNRAAIGYDMFSEPVRNEAMSRARDSGEPAASAQVTLVQEIDRHKQAGFLLYVPVYAQPADGVAVETRRALLRGFVYSPFRVDDLMRGIFGTQREPRVAFDLYDGAEPRAIDLMHKGIPAGAEPARHVAIAPLDVGGRRWSLRVQTTRAFDAASSLRLFPYLAAIAALINLAILLLTRSQVRARREEVAASARLQTLAETSKRFSEARLDLDVVLNTVCIEVARRMRESCSINLIDAQGERLDLSETHHLDPEAERAARELLSQNPIRVGETSLGRVAATGVPLLMPKVPARTMAPAARPEHRSFAERFPIASLLIVPLRVGERVIGTMSASRGPSLPPFTAQDQRLLQELGDRAALAIENARLAEKLRLSMSEAQEAVRVRDEFLSIAGHELKTPLAALQLQVEGILHQAEKGQFGPAPQRLLERLVKAQTHVDRLGSFIAGLLDVARIAAGKLTLQYEQVDLSEMLGEIVDRFAESLSRARCEVSLRGDSEIVGRWDRVRLDQVFTNLLGNALKYGGGKPIEIEMRRIEGHASVAVSDHGIGISPEDQPRVFERFERAVSERRYPGLGLGLWISQEIVQALGGTIELRSQLGLGSTFTVRLPLEPAVGPEPHTAAAQGRQVPRCEGQPTSAEDAPPG